MSWGSPVFVLTLVGIGTLAYIITISIRAAFGYPLDSVGGGPERRDPDDDRKIELLSNENGELKDKIVRLEDRISVLERIATDKSVHLSDEIESLRDHAEQKG